MHRIVAVGDFLIELDGIVVRCQDQGLRGFIVRARVYRSWVSVI